MKKVILIMVVFFGMKSTPAFCQSQPISFKFTMEDSAVVAKKPTTSLVHRIAKHLNNFLFSSDRSSIPETTDKIVQGMPLWLLSDQEKFFNALKNEIKQNYSEYGYQYHSMGIKF